MAGVLLVSALACLASPLARSALPSKRMDELLARSRRLCTLRKDDRHAKPEPRPAASASPASCPPAACGPPPCTDGPDGVPRPAPRPATVPARQAQRIHVHVRAIPSMTDLPGPFGLAVTHVLEDLICQSDRYRLAPPLAAGTAGEHTPCSQRGGGYSACLEVAGEIVRRSWYAPDRRPELSLVRMFGRWEHERFEVGLVVRVVDLSSGQVLLSRFLEDLIRSRHARDLHVRGHPPYTVDPFPVLGGELEKNSAIFAHRMVDILDEAVALAPVTPSRGAPVEAAVLHVDRDSVAVAAGHDRGVVVGEILKVVRPGAGLVDPATGERIGKREVWVGELRVIRVRDHVAECEPVDNGPPPPLTEYREGDIARR